MNLDLNEFRDISPSILSFSLDDSGNVARKLGLQKRKYNDAKVVVGFIGISSKYQIIFERFYFVFEKNVQYICLFT